MKRFYLALLLLLVIISTSIFLNYKIISETSELIKMIDQNQSQKNIEKWWNKNNFWFDILISEDDYTSLKLEILKLKSDENNHEIRNNLRIYANKISETSEFNIKNVF